MFTTDETRTPEAPETELLTSELRTKTPGDPVHELYEKKNAQAGNVIRGAD